MASKIVRFSKRDVREFNSRMPGANLTEVSGWFEFDKDGNLVDEEHGRACEHDSQEMWRIFCDALQEKHAI